MRYIKQNFFVIHYLIVIVSIFSQVISRAGGDPHPNQITIRNDRVFMLNGHPFFPIGVCFELGENAYANEMKKLSGGTYGFNFINLFTQNANLYNCFQSKNVISGDLSSGSQYNNVLSRYWDAGITAQINYERIKAYLDDGVYLLSEDFAFHPDDYTHWAWNNTPLCTDDITINPPFNQQVRNDAINRVNNLAMMNDSKIMGFYSDDDANMFMGGPLNDPLYYYNNFKNNRIQNLSDSYNHAKSVYSNSLVLMSLPATFFPRVFDYNNWQNINAARDAWVSDAVKFTAGANVLFAPGYLTMEDPVWPASFRIYDYGYPNYYIQHVRETLINRVLSASNEPKAVLGGLIFDIWQSNPAWDDPKMNDKVKWEIYTGLQSGATGLIFFGWHKKDEDFIDRATGQRVYYRPIWDAIRHQVDTLVNIKHLDEIFTKTNLGQIGHTITGSNSLGTISYSVYKTYDSSWADFYLLVTNNPGGSVFGPDEGTNNFTVRCDAHNLMDYSITETFSNNSIRPEGLNTFTYSLPWFGTAMFHITNHIKPVISPTVFFLNQNYPNPFNPVTQIKYGTSKEAFITIELFDGIGRYIKTLVNEKKSAGAYILNLDGSNYSSGIYFYRMKTTGFEKTMKMLLVK